MSFTKPFLLGSLILLAIFSPVRSQEKIACDPNNRPTDCPDLGLSFSVQICGLFTTCSDDTCSQNYDSECSACLDPNVEFYLLGACPDENIIEENPIVTNDMEINLEICSSVVKGADVNGQFVAGTSCCGIRNDICFDSNPVCGYLSNCEGDSCRITKTNSCDACSDTSVDFYIPGPCEGDFSTLGEEEDFNEEAGLDQDETVDGMDSTLTDGAESPEPFFCDPASPPSCTADQVCAYLRDCFEGPCNYLADNNCAACSDQNVMFYVIGECSNIF